MYEDFEKRFDYTLKGDFKRWYERIEDVGVWGWCKAQQAAVEQRVQRTAIAAFFIGGFVFLGIRWLVFGG